MYIYIYMYTYTPWSLEGHPEARFDRAILKPPIHMHRSFNSDLRAPAIQSSNKVLRPSTCAGQVYLLMCQPSAWSQLGLAGLFWVRLSIHNHSIISSFHTWFCQSWSLIHDGQFNRSSSTVQPLLKNENWLNSYLSFSFRLSYACSWSSKSTVSPICCLLPHHLLHGSHSSRSAG